MEKSILENNLMRKKVSNKNSFEIETEEKLSRNDDCWCGSGKKYKKCHCSFVIKYLTRSNLREEAYVMLVCG